MWHVMFTIMAVSCHNSLLFHVMFTCQGCVLSCSQYNAALCSQFKGVLFHISRAVVSCNVSVVMLSSLFQVLNIVSCGHNQRFYSALSYSHIKTVL